ncbi:MAG: DNA polymerase IV [Sphingobacteriales bacterium]|jgi:DNA polymerase-4|nr:MAG: DNA polymerase IV [Sphingobacteriales bacterium]
MNANSLDIRLEPRVLFIDMNSFFATCEQQTNYWLRGRPVAVCVYTGKYGCVIAPSIEAKKKGIRLGMRLNDAIKICPDLVPLETNPNKYRSYHIKIMNVLRQYADDVVPRSIDEAVVDLSNYKRIYPDMVAVAQKIKQDIKEQVGDWLQCSIGIAPNAFLAKLASDIQKPDGLVVINPENIDSVISKLELTDFPGISNGIKQRLNKVGIYTPLQLRQSTPEVLKAACKSIIGLHWYYRLHFQEVDMLSSDDYKSISAMRHLSKEQRNDIDSIKEVFMLLCLTLERRLMKKGRYAQNINFFCKYEDGTSFEDKFHTEQALRDGMEIYHILLDRQKQFRDKNNIDQQILNNNIISIGIVIHKFVEEGATQLNMFNNKHIAKDKAMKKVYEIKQKYGENKIKRASEMRADDTLFVDDVIGFGNIKDLL